MSECVPTYIGRAARRRQTAHRCQRHSNAVAIKSNSTPPGANAALLTLCCSVALQRFAADLSAAAHSLQHSVWRNCCAVNTLPQRRAALLCHNAFRTCSRSSQLAALRLYVIHARIVNRTALFHLYPKPTHSTASRALHHLTPGPKP